MAGRIGSVRALPATALIVAVVVAPAGLLATYAFRETTFLGPGPGPTLQQFRSLLQSDYFVPIAVRTVVAGLLVGAAVTLLAFVVGYGTKFRFSRRAGSLILGGVIAAGIASFLVRIFAWGTILGSNGLVNRLLEFAGLADRPVGFLFYSTFAVVVTMTYLYLPIGIAMIYGAMQDLDAHAVEAGRDLGVGRWRTATQIVAPQIRGSLTTCFVLVTIMASADYVTPSLVGGTKGAMIGVVIRDRALSSSDLPGSSAIALFFLAILLATIAALLVLLRGGALLLGAVGPVVNRIASVAVEHAPSRLSRMSVSRPASLILAAYLIVPTLVVLIFSFNGTKTLGFPWQGFTTDWYADALGRPGLAHALWTSVLIAVAASFTALTMGTMLAFALQTMSRRARASLLVLATLPFVIPGVLVGLGLLALSDVTGLPQGAGLTTAAHVALLIPVVVVLLLGRLATLNPELVQAARDLGSSPARAFATVTLPLIAPSLVAAFMISFAISMDEVFITTFTIGADTTLPTWILGRARLGFDPGLNAIGVLLVAGTIVVPALLYLAASAASRRSHGTRVVAVPA